LHTISFDDNITCKEATSFHQEETHQEYNQSDIKHYSVLRIKL